MADLVRVDAVRQVAGIIFDAAPRQALAEFDQRFQRQQGMAGQLVAELARLLGIIGSRSDPDRRR